jgi:hypothetical protein
VKSYDAEQVHISQSEIKTLSEILAERGYHNWRDLFDIDQIEDPVANTVAAIIARWEFARQARAH